MAFGIDIRDDFQLAWIFDILTLNFVLYRQRVD